MWLASVSLRDAAGDIVPSPLWDRHQRDRAKRTAMWLLQGAGDPAKERGFRMNVTLCVHRWVRDDELEQLPAEFFSCRGFLSLAGAPIQVMWEHGIPSSPTTQPCVNPRRVPLDDYVPESLKRRQIRNGQHLWFPVDCGECFTCQARLVVEREGKPYNACVAQGLTSG